MCPKPQKTVIVVTFTEKILNEKLHLLSSEFPKGLKDISSKKLLLL